MGCTTPLVGRGGFGLVDRHPVGRKRSPAGCRS